MQSHDEHFEPELDVDVRRALDASGPAARVEESIVRRLKESQFLASGPSGHTRLRSASPRRGSRWLAVGAIAAGVTVAFQLGVRTGELRAQRVSSAVLSDTAGPARESELARVVSAAALEYVNALALVQATDTVARDVAVRTLAATTDQLLRVAPDKDIALALADAFPTLGLTPASTTPPASQSRIIWY